MSEPISEQRRFVSPEPGEDWKAIAARALPGEDADAAVEKLKSWNLHLLVRMPPGEFLGSDVLFIEPPRERGPSLLGDLEARTADADDRG